MQLRIKEYSLLRLRNAENRIDMKKQIQFILNGKKVSISAQPVRILLDVLREDFGLTGTKEGCKKGECGACTVLMNGKAVNSCLITTNKLNGKSIVTIEGLSKGDKLDKIQQAFIDEGAVQCGYCIPGMIMTAKALLKENPQPTKEEIKYGIAGNLCRCTGYKKIISAIEKCGKEK